MKFFRAVGTWLAKAFDLASRFLYEALAASSPEGTTGFDVFGRRVSAVVVWLTGALLMTIPFLNGALASALGDAMFRTGTTMWST